MSPKKPITDYRIPIPESWNEALMFFFHDKHKLFNLVILVYALVISPFIIFTKNNPEMHALREVSIAGITTWSTIQFIQFGNTILLCLGIIHANYLLHILWEKIRGKQ